MKNTAVPQPSSWLPGGSSPIYNALMRVSQVLTHFILITPLWIRHFYYHQSPLSYFQIRKLKTRIYYRLSRSERKGSGFKPHSLTPTVNYNPLNPKPRFPREKNLIDSARGRNSLWGFSDLYQIGRVISTNTTAEAQEPRAGVWEKREQQFSEKNGTLHNGPLRKKVLQHPVWWEFRLCTYSWTDWRLGKLKYLFQATYKWYKIQTQPI